MSESTMSSDHSPDWNFGSQTPVTLWNPSVYEQDIRPIPLDSHWNSDQVWPLDHVIPLTIANSTALLLILNQKLQWWQSTGRNRAMTYVIDLVVFTLPSKWVYLTQFRSDWHDSTAPEHFSTMPIIEQMFDNIWLCLFCHQYCCNSLNSAWIHFV